MPSPIAGLTAAPAASFNTHGPGAAHPPARPDASPPFLRQVRSAHADAVMDAASRNLPLKESAKKFNAACAQHQDALVQRGVSNPEYLGSAHSDHLRRRVGASIETLVYRDPASGETALIETARSVGMGKPRVIALSCLSIKADGNVVRNGKPVTRNDPDLAKIENQITAMKEAVAADQLLRRPGDINGDIAPPWKAPIASRIP